MLDTLRAMPVGVRIFVAYSLLVLSFLGLTLPLVVAQAVDAPVSGIGLLWMLLLAYLIFTLTLVLQRKQAAFGLSLGLATLTLPLIPFLAIAAGVIGLAGAVALSLLVFGGLLRRTSRAWFSEP